MNDDDEDDDDGDGREEGSQGEIMVHPGERSR